MIYSVCTRTSRLYQGRRYAKEDALQNIREAIILYLEPIEDDAVFSETAEQIEITV